MKILVTGSSGVIGQNLVPRLEAAGHEVIPYDLRDYPPHDILDPLALRVVFGNHRPDACIHMAAQVGRYNGEDYPADSVNRNIVGTLNVVKACVEYGVRLISFSTSEVYGHNSVFGTPDILEQNGVYGLTKLAAEGVVKHYVDTYGLKAISVRPFMVYGPHESPNGVFRSALSNFLDTAMRGGVIEAHEGCVRSWCYVDDFCDGIMLLLAYQPDGYEAICIGTDEYRSMEDAAQVAVATVGKGSYVVKPVPPSLVSAVKKADFSTIRSLGFFPRVGLEEGARRTYEWMCSR